VSRGSVTVVAGVCLALLVAGVAAGEGVVARPSGEAIQFSIQSGFVVRDFGALTLAYQRYVAPDVALRLGLTLDLHHESGDYGQLYITEQEGEVYDESVEHGEWDHSGHLSCEWIWYRGERLALYYGGGPRIFYSSWRDEHSSFYTDYSWHRRQTVESYGAGIQSCLGMQWAVCDWLVLQAEYDAWFTYTRYSSTVQELRTGEAPRFTEEKDTSDRFTLDSRGVRMGLSVYY